jgi:hypothetical protein
MIDLEFNTLNTIPGNLKIRIFSQGPENEKPYFEEKELSYFRTNVALIVLYVIFDRLGHEILN